MAPTLFTIHLREFQDSELEVVKSEFNSKKKIIVDDLCKSLSEALFLAFKITSATRLCKLKEKQTVLSYLKGIVD
jgi:hypothetical protein